eukprot:2041214-Rhodomonas_salina.2
MAFGLVESDVDTLICAKDGNDFCVTTVPEFADPDVPTNAEMNVRSRGLLLAFLFSAATPIVLLRLLCGPLRRGREGCYTGARGSLLAVHCLLTRAVAADRLHQPVRRLVGRHFCARGSGDGHG